LSVMFPLRATASQRSLSLVYEHRNPANQHIQSYGSYEKFRIPDYWRVPIKLIHTNTKYRSVLHSLAPAAIWPDVIFWVEKKGKDEGEKGGYLKRGRTKKE
jgi:hypothetical protein